MISWNEAEDPHQPQLSVIPGDKPAFSSMIGRRYRWPFNSPYWRKETGHQLCGDDHRFVRAQQYASPLFTSLKSNMQEKRTSRSCQDSDFSQILGSTGRNNIFWGMFLCMSVFCHIKNPGSGTEMRSYCPSIKTEWPFHEDCKYNFFCKASEGYLRVRQLYWVYWCGWAIIDADILSDIKSPRSQTLEIPRLSNDVQ